MPDPINLTSVRCGGIGTTMLPHTETRRIILAAAQHAADDLGFAVVVDHGDGITAVAPHPAVPDATA